jgi:Fe2+ transport system protein FeoA
LTDLPVGTLATVARLEQQEGAVLQYLSSLGLVLGARVVVEKIAPFGGVYTIRVGAEEASTAEAIGADLARHVLVTPEHGRKKARDN